MNKSTKIILGLVLVVAAAALGFSFLSAPTGGSSANTSTTMPQVTDADWQIKAEGSKVTLVEYADFQCPACGAYYPLVKQLEADYAGKITFVFRHFPLSIHPNAVPAALAAEAAGGQGKFFEMSELLFTRQEAWSSAKTPEDIFVTYATELGLDIEKFKTDMSNPDAKQKIVDSFKGGQKAKVSGTPTFFLNGVKLENPKGNSVAEVLANFKVLLDKKLLEEGTVVPVASSTIATATSTNQ